MPSPAKPSSPPGKLLGLDVGLARIGVAVCDPLGLAARPLTVIERGSKRADFAHLADIARAEEIEAVICGLPLNMDGSEGDQARTTRRWADRLAQALRALLGAPRPLIFWDERLSSHAADELLAAGGVTALHDAVAAAVILQSYLDARHDGRLADYGRIDLPPKQK